MITHKLYIHSRQSTIKPVFLQLRHSVCSHMGKAPLRYVCSTGDAGGDRKRSLRPDALGQYREQTSQPSRHPLTVALTVNLIEPLEIALGVLSSRNPKEGRPAQQSCHKKQRARSKRDSQLVLFFMHRKHVQVTIVYTVDERRCERKSYVGTGPPFRYAP